MTKVTVWSEFRQERSDPEVGAVYPEGIHAAIAAGLRDAGFDVRTATLDEPEHGLTERVLAETDVLTWWGHAAHGDVDDAIVDRVQRRVLDGMGLIVLHSGHHSKIFRRLMGTTGDLKWREAGERERLWVVDRAHPIADGLGEAGQVSIIPPTTAVNTSGLVQLCRCTTNDPDGGGRVAIGENSVAQFILGFHGQAVGPFGAVLMAKYSGGVAVD